MKKIILFSILIVLGFTLFGCSASGLFGGSSTAGGDSNGGNMTLTVHWPAADKSSVLASAYSLKINVCTQFTTSSSTTVYRREVYPKLIIHNSSNTTETITMNGIPVGERVVIVQAYDGNAAEIGYGTSSVSIKVGENDGVTISLNSGALGYELIGLGDVTLPTSGSGSGGGGGGSGGGGGTTLQRYIFVNNYGSDGSSTSSSSISIINQNTNSVVGNIYGIPNPTKGAFNPTGTTYYVASGNSSSPCIYKIYNFNTNDWSCTKQVISNFPVGDIPQEILYEKVVENEYLWVGVKYYNSSNMGYAAYIRRINLSDSSYSYIKLPDLTAYSKNFEFVGFYDPPTAVSSKIIALYTEENPTLVLKATVAYPSDTNISIGPVLSIGTPSNALAETIRTTGIAMQVNSVFVPYFGGLKKIIFDNSNNSLTSPNNYTGISGGIKLLPYGDVIYGINDTNLKYATIGSLSSWTPAGSSFGSGLADMIFSSDFTKLYITAFGGSGSGGDKVYVKTLSNLTGNPAEITVGNNPFGITLKP